MIKAKQSEREGKRVDGDVKKEQRHLNHTLKDLDIGIRNKKKNNNKYRLINCP